MYLGLLVFSTILGLNEKKKKKTVFMQVSLLSHSHLPHPPPRLRFCVGISNHSSRKNGWHSHWRHLLKWKRKEQLNPWHHRAHLRDESFSSLPHPIPCFCDPLKPLQWWSPRVLTWSPILRHHFSKTPRRKAGTFLSSADCRSANTPFL